MEINNKPSALAALALFLLGAVVVVVVAGAVDLELALLFLDSTGLSSSSAVFLAGAAAGALPPFNCFKTSSRCFSPPRVAQYSSTN